VLRLIALGVEEVRGGRKPWENDAIIVATAPDHDPPPLIA
jgi:hypothetical protein